ncbi:unnamed protein product [Peniophora sp. CBMAI 1063]|nr:unnamed protein product [Peniophora sp. CBMAI 1063]
MCLIGASVLQAIAKDPNYIVTALVRSEEKATKITELLPGVKTIVGSLDDAELLTETACKSDVVLQMAAFHLAGIGAPLEGAKKRVEATGKAPIFINTSGTGIWAHIAANGAPPLGKVTRYTDTDLVETFIDLPHTPPTKAVIEAAAAGYAKAFTSYPSTVWGEPAGPLSDSGVAHIGSIQVPAVVKASIGRGQGGVVGEGLNVWNHVHIADTTKFYVLLPAKAVDGSAPSRAAEGRYILENGLYQYLKPAQIDTEALRARGKSASSKLSKFKQEFDASSFLFFFGANSTTASPRSRSISWAPKYTTEDFYDSVPKEVDVLSGKRKLYLVMS